MTLSVTSTFALEGNYTGARGRMSGLGKLSEGGTLTLIQGTAAGQADGIFSDEPSIAAGDSVSYFLSSGLQDLYGASLDFSAVKIILIEADLTNTADMVVGGGSWAGPFGDPSCTIRVKPGCRFQMECSDANGWPVDPNNDELRIACAGLATGGVTLIGVSSVISAPGWSLKPEIIGTPMVGVEVDCTPGDWSGSPGFFYQWTVGGTKKAGATGASYTPVAADAGKALVRITIAQNTAGQTSITTAPELILAAQQVTSDLDLTSGATRLTVIQ